MNGNVRQIRQFLFHHVVGALDEAFAQIAVRNNQNPDHGIVRSRQQEDNGMDQRGIFSRASTIIPATLKPVWSEISLIPVGLVTLISVR